MALTQGARNKIKSIVQSAKKLLMKEFESQLQQYYGIRPDGTCLLVEELTSREASVIETARLLRQRLHYLEEGIAGSNKAPEAVRQLIREQAFTILNRFAAVRMSEERNIIRESIRRGYNSEGFLVYDQLTGGAKTAEQFTRYTWYIGHVFDELAIDLPAVFDRFSPYALLFPSEKVLLELLEIINDEDLNIYRESGHQPINLWTEDETIGWIFQYYNSREEISEMREASGAPRNSRELAVRNQFFTPRYVVQFLVDNSLGRQWFEMTKGQTALVDSCQYMVKREQEIFLEKGEEIPEAKIEGANYIEYRQLKDPREILMLDPACGSMHFGLYCFDLFEQIYLEAWDNHPELMIDLRDKYMRDDFIKHIPGYILRYNIHGVDIDPRAIQIAGLSLWLRAQKSYDKLGLQPADRPAISKSNLVIAEPMPGDAHLLSEFTKSLPGPIGKLVRVIWDKMQFAGETGLLLKIEEELKKEIEIAKAEYKEYKNTSAQSTLFASPAESKAAQMAAIYGKGQKIKKDFFDTAEEEVLKALKGFSENAEGEDAFKKLLFAEDTARGFAFIELCRKRYDVIVMNPPFGAAAEKSKDYIDSNYLLSKADLASAFIDRMIEVCQTNGMVSSITTRTLYFIGSHKEWRKQNIIGNQRVKYFVDLGGGVLDAMVETCATVYSLQETIDTAFIRITKDENKQEALLAALNDSRNAFFIKNIYDFLSISNYPFCYWLDNKTLNFFQNTKKFETSSSYVRQGLGTADNFRFIRSFWEVNKSYWKKYLLGEGTIRYYNDSKAVTNWKNNGYELKNFYNSSGKIKSRVQGEDSYFHPGISWAYRTEKFQPHVVSEGEITGVKRYKAVFFDDAERDLILYTTALWNSKYFDYCIKLSMEKDYQPRFINGLVNLLPNPKVSSNLKEKLIEISKKQFYSVKYRFRIDEKSRMFSDNKFIHFENLSSYVDYRERSLMDLKNEFKSSLIIQDKLVFDEFEITKDEQNDIDEIVLKAGVNEEGEEFIETKISIINSVSSIIFGCVYGRWDLRILKFWNIDWSDEEIFKDRKHSPFFYGPKESTLDLVLPEYHCKINEMWEMPYPIEVFEEVASVSDINPITDKLKEVIKYFWPETFGAIEEELLEHFKVNDLSEIYDKHNKFFDAHLKDYTRNKRISPIYWHLGVPSGKFNVWLYYPKLNDGSLFKIVNELVDPKIKEVAKEVEVLEMKGSGKELNDQKEFLAELEDLKEELLRVAQLPYKPNQDDGVLITAAPLHKLFRHTKWKKSTQDCWKKLEEGEYDWAHLAYSIWPDRVRKKCVKDLSMAIAHGLEEICEAKPKETKKKKPKEIKADSQKKLI